jgi:outer membrane biosynthesis protein TonB
MRAAIYLGIGVLLAAAVPGLQAQVSPSTPGNVKTALSNAGQAAPPAAKPAAPAPTRPAAQTTKPAMKPAAKPMAKKPAAKPAVKKAETTTTASTAAPAESEVKQARRDPFESLIGRQQAQSAANKNLPPGKAGLQVSTLRLDGIVKASNGMIAVVSNPQLRTYFLREGDHLYDGTVEKISMDGVSFHEEGKDAFGQPVERQVNKRIYPSAGEQQ